MGGGGGRAKRLEMRASDRPLTTVGGSHRTEPSQQTAVEERGQAPHLREGPIQRHPRDAVPSCEQRWGKQRGGEGRRVGGRELAVPRSCPRPGNRSSPAAHKIAPGIRFCSSKGHTDPCRDKRRASALRQSTPHNTPCHSRARQGVLLTCLDLNVGRDAGPVSGKL